MTFLKGCELKAPAEGGSLNTCPVLNPFLVTALGDFRRAVVYSQPRVLGNIKGPSVQLVYLLSQKTAQGGSISSCSTFLFPFSGHSLLFYFGVELISDIVFVSGVWAFDSLRHRRLSVLLGVLFLI